MSNNIHIPKKFPNVLETEAVMGAIGGEYLVQIMRTDGSRYCPFGESYRKNVILDTFFKQILNNNYDPYTMSLFLCGCNLGNDPTPANRLDPHQEGWSKECLSGNPNCAPGAVQALKITYLSAYYNFDIVGDEIRMFRDFIFRPETSQQTYRDCWISHQRGNVVTVASTSRFVFPANITVNTGERVIINYRLTIKMPYIQPNQTNNAPFYLNNGSMNFDGNWGFTSSIQQGLFHKFNGNSVYFSWYWPQGNLLSFSNTITQMYWWNFILGYDSSYTESTCRTAYSETCQRASSFVGINDGASTSPSVNGGGHMQVSPFGINTRTITSQTSRHSRFIGFFDSAHIPKQFDGTNSYSSCPIPAWTMQGPASVVTTPLNTTYADTTGWLTNFQQSDSESSIDHQFVFPAHTVNRTVGGIYFNSPERRQYAVNAHWLKFNTAQTIPAGQGISIKLRWIFKRL